MKYIIVGAPGAGKQALMEDIAKHFGFSTNDGMYIPKDEDYLVGRLADYRVELMLAIDRAFAATSQDEATADIVYSHSLIDSATYAALRLIDTIESKASDDAQNRWVTTSSAAALLLKDSFRYDLIFFLKGGDKDIEEALGSVLDSLELPHTVLNDDDNSANCINVIEEWIATR